MAAKRDRVKRALEDTVPVDDAPFDPDAGPEAKPRKRRPRAPEDTAPPGGPQVDVFNLTPAQWDTLRRCAGRDENDTDNGKRLLDWFGDRILCVNEAGWHEWTGTHWDAETGQLAVERFAQQLVPLIKREAGLIEPTEDEEAIIAEAEGLRQEHPNVRRRSDDVKAAIKLGDMVAKAVAARAQGRFQFAIKTGDRGRTRALIDQAGPHRTVLPKQMDTDDFALNTMSGTLRFAREVDDENPDEKTVRYLVRKRLDPHKPADLITKVTAARFDPKAKCPNFDRDFARYMPRAENREMLQVAMGYTALGVTGEQVFFFLYGDGSNWKSSFTQAIARTLGQFVKPMNYASISGQNAPSGDKPSPDWARLPGVRMLTIEEVPKREQLREELIKMITSGSDMPVRHLNKGLFDMRTTFTAWMLSNGEPNITGGDDGIWRRTIIIRWDEKIPEAERKPFDQVMAMYEAERDGILNWIVAGIEKYLANGLQPYITEEMRAFARSVRRDRDAVGAFIEDCVEVAADEGYFVPARTFYQAFQKYCGVNGVDPVPSETSFGSKVKRVTVGGIQIEKRRKTVDGARRYYGIRLHNLPADEHPYAPGGSD